MGHFSIRVVYAIQTDFQNFEKINEEFLKKNRVIIIATKTRERDETLFYWGGLYDSN